MTLKMQTTIIGMCEVIAGAFQEKGISVRNLRTGRTIPNAAGEYTAEDVYRWDSNGELIHVWEWHEMVNSDIWRQMPPASTPSQPVDRS